MATSSPRPLRSAAAFLLFCLAVVRAQIYTFEDTPIPTKKTLVSLYAVYVYSKEDAGVGSDPYIKFSGMTLRDKPGTTVNEALKMYEGVEVGMLWISTFEKNLDLARLCTSPWDVSKGLAKHGDQLMLFHDNKGKNATTDRQTAYPFTVKYEKQDDFEYKIKDTGAYILMISNCGTLDDGVISGTVTVKNPYGYLPGSEFMKMPFYGFLFFVYAALASVWAAFCLKWRAQLIHIHHCVSVVVGLCILEAGLWWTFYNDWNVSGLVGKPLLAVSMFSSVVKTTFSYMLVLVASLGWGITRPHLERSTVIKLQVLTVSYIILNTVDECMLAFQRNHVSSLTFAMLCMLPVAILNGIVFYWIIHALSSMVQTLRDSKQQEKVKLFESLWRVLTTALVFSCLDLIVQLIFLSRDLDDRWKSHWIFDDVMRHSIFLFVFLAMMYLWKPNANSPLYAFSHQLEEEDNHEDWDPSFTAVTPDKIGNEVFVDA